MPSCQSRQSTSDEETLDGRNAVIERTNPSRGPMSGGPEIWISGSNFPTATTPFYARFGDHFALAVGVPPRSLGQHLTTPRLFKNLTCSRAICRKRMFPARLQSFSLAVPISTLLLWVRVYANSNTLQTSTRCELCRHPPGRAHIKFLGCPSLFVSKRTVPPR